MMMLLLVATSAFAAVDRNVKPGAAGPNRLDVDVPLLSRSASDLRDLRLYDPQQREVGYLLVEPEAREAQWLDARVLPIAATKTTSGFEADFGRATNVDRLRVEGIAAPFLKRARVEGSGDRAHWTLLADATLFDLPDDQLRLHDVMFTPGEYRYVRVTWDDRSSARITTVGRVSARVHGTGAAPEPLRAEVPFRKRASEPGKSRYRIDLPGPHLPLAAIEVRVANGNVFRDAAITEPRLNGAQVLPSPLGSARLKRAERWGSVAEEMAVPIGAPEGRELDLVIDDGNNPPLAIISIVARFAPQPWIYFESSDGSTLTARYGDVTLEAPRYDIEASRRFVHDAKVALATWVGAAGASPADASRRAGAPAAPTFLGAPVSRKSFQFSRPIPKATPGLTVLALDADVLARSRELADVRIVDSKGNQVPYLVERRDEPLVLKLALPQRTAEGSTSTYAFTLPYATLPYGTSLVVTTTARVFDRAVTLRRDDGVLASETWHAADPELLPPALRFEAPRGARDVQLVIDEGDNAPLPLASAELLLPSYALRFTHPGAPLFLVYGNATAQPPRYDLALLAPRLFGEPARELTLGAAAPPAHEEEHRERNFFWIGIAIVAVVLIALLARLLAPLAREESQPLR
ncbi:MAG TPA: DUF3999 family protein [Thermoanaerobaculia bacterium]|nr:DUF3999 family protein [Thermoanaerobaculia bacterium]